MTKVTVARVGENGINKDVDPQMLPPNAWSDGQNVRTKDGSLQRVLGDEEIVPAGNPGFTFLHPMFTEGKDYWLLATDKSVDAYDFDTFHDVTQTGVTYSADDDNPWVGTTHLGTPILTNPNDVPQAQFPGSFSQELADLPNWQAGYRARVIRSFKNYLVAINITKNAGDPSPDRFPNMVKWSDESSSGNLPGSWDQNDTNVNAGEATLGSEGDPLENCLPLGDTMFLYTRTQTWGMQFIGGNFIFRFYPVFSDLGCPGPNCVAEYAGRHIVLTDEDVFIHDGNSKNSLLNGRMRTHLQNKLDDVLNGTDLSFFANVRYLESREEVWITLPTKTGGQADEAIIWNVKDDSLTLTSLPDMLVIDEGVRDHEAATNAHSRKRGVFGVGSSFNRLDSRLLDNSSGEAIPKFEVVREGLAIVGQDSQNRILSDETARKMVTEVWPKLDIDADHPVKVYVGSQEDENDSIDWSGPHSFNPRNDTVVPVMKAGRLIAVKFVVDTEAQLTFHGYVLEVKNMGQF